MNELIVQLISGAIGGNAVGMAMKDKSLGPIGNTIAGLLGGAGGGKLLAVVAPQLIDSLAGQIGGAGIGGAVVMFVASLLKGMLVKK